MQNIIHTRFWQNIIYHWFVLIRHILVECEKFEMAEFIPLRQKNMIKIKFENKFLSEAISQQSIGKKIYKSYSNGNLVSVY